MAKIRVTVCINSGKHGWSETLFRDGTVEGSVAAAIRYGSIRKGAIVGLVANIEYIRISDDAVRRDALIIPTDDIPPPNLVSAGLEPAPPWNCLLMRLAHDNNPPRNLYLRPVPTKAIGAGQARLAVQTFDKTVTALEDELKTGGWMINSHGSAVNHADNITGYVNAAGIVTVNCPAHHFVDNDQVRITGGSGAGRPLGLFRITGADVNSFKLIGTFPQFVYLGGSKAVGQDKALSLINKAQSLRISHRDTGRPFGLQAGRGRVRK